MKPKGHTLWFFGLPAAGKTTLARKTVSESPDYVLLDGDEVRHAVGNFNMDQNARSVHLSYMAFCCRQLNDAGINVAAAFVTPLESQRARIRQMLPDVNFIWLRCGVETCVRRDPKGLWKKAARGDLPQLTGAGGEWEDATDASLILRTDELSVEAAFARIQERFKIFPAKLPAGRACSDSGIKT